MQVQHKLSTAPFETAPVTFAPGGPVAEMQDTISNRISALQATGNWQVNHGSTPLVDTIKLQKLGYAMLAGLGAGAVLFVCSLPVLL